MSEAFNATRRRVIQASIPVLSGMWPKLTMAQELKREVRLIVPFPAGGPVDIIGRILGNALPQRIGGHPVLINNRPGASGFIGLQVLSLVNVASVPVGLVSSSSNKLTDIAAIIAAGRESPGTLTYSSAGHGTTPYLTGEWFYHLNHVHRERRADRPRRHRTFTFAGMEPEGKTREAFRERIKTDRALWARIIHDVGIKVAA